MKKRVCHVFMLILYELFKIKCKPFRKLLLSENKDILFRIILQIPTFFVTLPKIQ